MNESEAETLLSENLILRIIESEDITVEIEKEITKVLLTELYFNLCNEVMSCMNMTKKQKRKQLSTKYQ